MKDPQYGKGVLLLHCNERVIGRIKDSKIKIPALIYNAGQMILSKQNYHLWILEVLKLITALL